MHNAKLAPAYPTQQAPPIIDGNNPGMSAYSMKYERQNTKAQAGRYKNCLWLYYGIFTLVAIFVGVPAIILSAGVINDDEDSN